jgi:hypothetical protein
LFIYRDTWAISPSHEDFSIGDFYNVEGKMVVQVRQAPHEVLLPASGEIQPVASDKGNPAGKPLGTGKEKRAAIKSQEKNKEENPVLMRRERWLSREGDTRF